MRSLIANGWGSQDAHPTHNPHPTKNRKGTRSRTPNLIWRDSVAEGFSLGSSRHQTLCPRIGVSGELARWGERTPTLCPEHSQRARSEGAARKNVRPERQIPGTGREVYRTCALQRLKLDYARKYLRRIDPAKPTTPVPSRTSDVGSGVGAADEVVAVNVEPSDTLVKLRAPLSVP
jgi:hypothetical protein